MPLRRCAMGGFERLADVIRRLIAAYITRHDGDEGAHGLVGWSQDTVLDFGTVVYCGHDVGSSDLPLSLGSKERSSGTKGMCSRRQ